MRTFVELILPLPLKQTFTYEVPKNLMSKCQIGKRVLVQFGSKKLYTAIVYSIHNNAPTQYKVKFINDFFDKTPIVTAMQLRLWTWGADYYLCSLGDFYKATVPSALRLASETNVVAIPNFKLTNNNSDVEKNIYNYLINNNIVSLKELGKISNKNNLIREINSLIEQKAVLVQEDIKQTYKPKPIKIIEANFDNNKTEINRVYDLVKNAKKQYEMLSFFVDKYLKNNVLDVKKTELIKSSQVSASVLKSLIDKNILTETNKEVLRIETNKIEQLQKPKTLNKYQDKALQQIQKQFEKNLVVLLHGVTSSGKTEVYIRLIMNALKEKKQVLYLLPEIALTPQIIQRLQTVFGNAVGVYHSKLSANERVEMWNKLIQNNNDTFKIIIGVRSSVLLPFSNLGLVVVDEEHENTYKQFDPAPRYHARDLAIILAKQHGAKVLLGSATPSVESYHSAVTKRYGLVTLNVRYDDIEMPEIILSDVKKAYKKKQMQANFTPLLIKHIEQELNNKKQIILFQNRRGFSPYIICKNCGWIPTCKHCDVSLTYHKHNNKLICHYCGFQISNTGKCQQCGQNEIQTKGFGTEKIEEEISLIFPNAKVARLDLDTTRNKHGHEQIIDKFKNNEIDILIGTQMVSKGLDFDNVSLVGILNADSMLSYPDFRAYERSYQLMAQVSGRAGRKNKRGKVIVQTSDTEHVIIKHVINNDYIQMFKEQLTERKMFLYPPFVRLMSITIKHKNKDISYKAANTLHYAINKINNIVVLGPIMPIVGRVQNLYLQQITIKLQKNKQLDSIKKLISEKCDKLILNKQFKQVVLVKNVDLF